MIHKSEWLNIATAAMVGIMIFTHQFSPNVDVDGIAEIIAADGIAEIIAADVPLPRKRPFTEKEIICMTDNVYHEARGEPGIGQRAVVDVVLNRMKDSKRRWPRDVCGVVYQPWAFSWTMDEAIVNDFGTWLTIKLRVKVWMENHHNGIVKANHYHTVDISPSWNNNMHKETVIGAHAFFQDF